MIRYKTDNDAFQKGGASLAANEEVNEPPDNGTAGLTSADQVIDATSVVSRFPIETTPVATSLRTSPVARRRLEVEPNQLGQLQSRRAEFKKAAKDSLHRNRDILEQLARR